MSAHTPGPWHVSNPTSGANEISDSDGTVLGKAMPPGINFDHPTMRANARLMATSPQMLAALKRCRALLSPAFCAGDPAAEEMRTLVRTVIASAEEL